MHQSSRALGISTLQLEADASQARDITVSKRPTAMSSLGQNKSKGMLSKPRSLIARMPIPSMDKEKAKQFKVHSTINLSERSPLIKQEKPNMYARMPTIFAKQKDEDGESNSIMALNDGTAYSQSPIQGIEQLVEEGGSAAYQLYQQQSEKMLRDRLIEQNSGVFLANQEVIKLARNESVSRVMMPRNFKHEATLTSELP